MTAVFNTTTSILGQPWRWRGGIMPGTDLDGRGADALLHHLFHARGASPDDFARLKVPTLREWLPDPAIFRDMEAAATRLADAIAAGESIVVFGDYDVDGATSAAVLIRYLRQVGATVGHYIPDRLLEGYGPSADALVALKAAGDDLVVTVDCGTQGFDALAAARAASLDVIVVDHHQAATALPDSLALVNPNRLDECPQAAAHGHLAAVGVAFLLVVALNRCLRLRGAFSAVPEPQLTALLDLVALGTVADVVPLTGLNRAFVTQGLKVMRARRNPGLTALIDAAGLTKPPVARDLGFALGPRVNAGGRVGKSDLGVRLLTTDDPAEAQALAQELDRLNIDRRTIEAEVTEAALALAGTAANSAIAVIAGAGWHPGVIGIVASRLKERLHRPAIVIALQYDGAGTMIGKGSGRSVPGVDLGAAVLAARDHGLLIAGGGHAMAAGLTVAAEKVDALAAFLNERLSGAVDRASGVRGLDCDAAVAPRGVNLGLVETLDCAGPYGQGWSQPRVASGPWTLIDCRIVGEHHVKLILSGVDGARCKAIAFRHADTALGAALMGARGKQFYLAGRIKRDDWKGEPSAEIEIDDMAWA
ncbi:single-stranded-DNA-specific exonuclease RecJ [Polymorphobacter fuscus]|uniref:Single-stranded-DNA-specific exonuclease RecJ n=1 Tax=Sandarakinorhabdus fusca TaxID=1439888 RepID=A0A7C9GRL7_9SPHN|nr:single-stranded-DNA-specific exonuclease RecJ [Polymorphobacter fuscus]KAB7643869.1 single-stranded-DNA-specific exonuclease RecJ [Polymorphobacter fuscus]MQT18570.1 single-stranded-DNA-specific exonuclease RecJ [Polymorphobacter fuscus]